MRAISIGFILSFVALFASAQEQTKTINGQRFTQDEFLAEQKKARALLPMLKTMSANDVSLTAQMRAGDQKNPVYDEDGIVESYSAAKAETFASLFPFMVVQDRGESARLRLQDELIPKRLKERMELVRVEATDSSGRTVLNERNLKPDGLGSWSVPIKGKTRRSGIKGTALIRFKVPAKVESVELSRKGESKAGWKLLDINDELVSLECERNDCESFVVQALTQDRRALLSTSTSQVTNGAVETLEKFLELKWDELPAKTEFKPKGSAEVKLIVGHQGPARTVRLAKIVSTRDLTIQSRVIADPFFEKNPKYVKFEVPKKLRICAKSEIDLARSIKFVAQRPQAPKDAKERNENEEPVLISGIAGPDCVNSRSARAYFAVELWSDQVDITGRIGHLIGPEPLAVVKNLGEVEADSNEPNQKERINEDLLLLRKKLKFKGKVEVEYPWLEEVIAPLESKLIKDAGIRWEKGELVFKSNGIGADPDALAANGYVISPNTRSWENGSTKLGLGQKPVKIRFWRIASKDKVSLNVDIKLPPYRLSGP